MSSCSNTTVMCWFNIVTLFLPFFPLIVAHGEGSVLHCSSAKTRKIRKLTRRRKTSSASHGEQLRRIWEREVSQRSGLIIVVFFLSLFLCFCGCCCLNSSQYLAFRCFFFLPFEVSRVLHFTQLRIIIVFLAVHEKILRPVIFILAWKVIKKPKNKKSNPSWEFKWIFLEEDLNLMV